ncbi:hypothetical protein CCP4SC76_5180029 [Gammaproteobacteria bacterium]
MESIPIIYIHRSPPGGLSSEQMPDYLLASLYCTHITNPTAPIFFLTDIVELPRTVTPSLDAAITRVNLRDYCAAADKFGEIFFNVSRNVGYFERWCIERWFILQSFLKAERIERCFTLDSDVLLFCDVQKEAERFAKFDYTIAGHYNWCQGFINKLQVLEVFCEMTSEVYSRSTALWLLICDYLNLFRPNTPVGNLSDMMLLRLFVEHVAGKHGLCYEDLSRVIEGSCYCTNITLPIPNVEMSVEHATVNPTKKITWINAFPYGKLMESGDFVRFNSLHFWSGYKALMVPYLNHFVGMIQTMQTDSDSAHNKFA